MAETPFTIGADARCSDGVCGKVTRVIVDPVKRAVTHLWSSRGTGLAWAASSRST